MIPLKLKETAEVLLGSNFSGAVDTQEAGRAGRCQGAEGQEGGRGQGAALGGVEHAAQQLLVCTKAHLRAVCHEAGLHAGGSKTALATRVASLVIEG